jgi:hypothetical protein
MKEPLARTAGEAPRLEAAINRCISRRRATSVQVSRFTGLARTDDILRRRRSAELAKITRTRRAHCAKPCL